MSVYRFRLLNVFAEAAFGGNPLCVFEDARGLDERTMQALALQFNLSETTFILPSERASARVRIFTPSFEMPFAGHPILGTAHVVRALFGGDAIRLETARAVVPVNAQGDYWTLEAGAPVARAVEPPWERLADLLGFSPAALGGTPRWIDTGVEQLIVPLTSPEAVAGCAPNAARLAQWPRSNSGQAMALLWAPIDDEQIEARFFFGKQDNVLEDPGTGSACANLGGWFVIENPRLPLRRRILQGQAVGRPCVLELRVETGPRIFVSGRVVQLGRGEISL